jgi:hypothetical protein
MSITVENNSCTIVFPNMDASSSPALPGTCTQGKCASGASVEMALPLRTALHAQPKLVTMMGR